MSLLFWRSIAQPQGDAGALTHLMSCVSPTARYSVEESDTGLLLQDRHATPQHKERTFMQLKVGVSPDRANRFLPWPTAVGILAEIATIPNARVAPLTIRQQAAVHMTRPSCFDWWVARANSCLPMSLVVLGEAAEPVIPLDGFGGCLLSLTVSNAAALTRLSATGSLPSVESLRVDGYVGSAQSALEAFPHLSVLALLRPRDGVFNSVDVGMLAECEKLQFVMLRSCRLLFPSQKLVGLQRLRILYVENCRAVWRWAWMPDLPKLEHLYLDIVNEVHVMPREPFPHFPRLRQISSTFSHLRDLKPLATCEWLERVLLRRWRTTSLSFSSLGGFVSLLRELVITDSSNLAEADLRACEGLVALEVSSCKNLKKVDLTGCTALETVDIMTCRSLTTVDGLESASKLRSLSARLCERLQFLDLGDKPLLEEVDIDLCNALTVAGLDFPSKNLRRLHIGSAAVAVLDVSPCSRISEIFLRKCKGLSRVDGLGGRAALTHLTLIGCDNVTLVDVSGSAALVEVKLRGCSRLGEVRGLAGLHALRTLSVDLCAALTAVDVSGDHNMTSLRCIKCAQLAAVKGVAGLGSLQRLVIKDCVRLAALDLSGSPALQRVTVEGCPHATIVGWAAPRDAANSTPPPSSIREPAAATTSGCSPVSRCVSWISGWTAKLNVGTRRAFE